MEPLTFKIITDADDSGVRRYEKSLGGVDVTSRKASSAIKGFVGDLQNAQSVSDVTSSALNALTKILGTSLAATGVVVVGKLLVDAFNKVNDAVKESTKSVAAANKEISKIALAGVSFETATRSADVLNKTADDLRKNLEKINESKLQSFIAGLTGAKDKMEELLATTTKQAQEQQKQAVALGLLDLERVKNADQYTKAAQEAAKPFEELIRLARAGGDANQVNLLIIKQQEAAAKAVAEVRKKEELGAIESTRKADEERIKERTKLEEEAADRRSRLGKEAVAEFNKQVENELKAQEDLRQKEEERLEGINKTIAGIEARKAALQEEIAIMDTLIAKNISAAGGSGRGPGQMQSSYEIGYEARMAAAELQGFKEQTRDNIQTMREESAARGESTSLYDIRNAMEKAEDEKAKQRGKERAGDYKKNKEELEAQTKALEDAKKEQDVLTESLEKAKEKVDEWGESLLDFIKDFEIPGKNMIEDFLEAGKGASNLGEAGNMVASALSAASAAGGSAVNALGDAASSAASKLADLGSKLPGAGDQGKELATEATLKDVLKELTENLELLRSYAHAT